MCQTWWKWDKIFVWTHSHLTRHMRSSTSETGLIHSNVLESVSIHPSIYQHRVKVFSAASEFMKSFNLMYIPTAFIIEFPLANAPIIGKKIINLFKVNEKGVLNSVLLPTLFLVVNNIVQHCYTLTSNSSGSTLLFNVVNNRQQCGQHRSTTLYRNNINIVFVNITASCSFLAMYSSMSWTLSDRSMTPSIHQFQLLSKLLSLKRYGKSCSVIIIISQVIG